MTEEKAKLYYGEFVYGIKKTYRHILLNYMDNIYWTLRIHRVPLIHHTSIMVVAALIACKLHGFERVKRPLISYLTEIPVDDMGRTAAMTVLHRLGDFRVLTVVRKAKWSKGFGKGIEPYEFMLTPEFWRKCEPWAKNIKIQQLRKEP